MYHGQVVKKYSSFGLWTRKQERRPGRRHRRFGRASRVLGALGAVLICFALVFVTVEVAGKAIYSGNLDSSRKSQAMRLTVPSMKRVHDVPVYTGASNDKKRLDAGTLHLRDTGFPWEREANVYIAGHRLGYPRTKSFLVFYDLNRMRRGDRMVLEDARGRRYIYRMFDKFVTAPNDLGVKKPPRGENIISLQTCTLPNYSRRLIVQGELVRELPPRRTPAARQGLDRPRPDAPRPGRSRVLSRS